MQSWLYLRTRMRRALGAGTNLLRVISLLGTAAACFVLAPAAAQAQSEVLQGTATTVSGQASSPCPSAFHPFVGVSFNAAGPATGPYPGEFTEKNGNANVSGTFLKPGYIQLRLGIPFTINAGSTTITGTISNPYPWIGGLFSCGAVIANASRATYTATIDSAGLVQTVSGSAQFQSTLSIQSGSTATVQETLALP